MNTCSQCRWCWTDDRRTIYRRAQCLFCLRKGPFFSRNTPVNTGNRVSPDHPACPEFEPADSADKEDM